MKEFGIIIGGITIIGSAINSMGHLTFESAFSYGIILLFSYVFVRIMWDLIDEKTKK